LQAANKDITLEQGTRNNVDSANNLHYGNIWWHMFCRVLHNSNERKNQ